MAAIGELNYATVFLDNAIELLDTLQKAEMKLLLAFVAECGKDMVARVSVEDAGKRAGLGRASAYKRARALASKGLILRLKNGWMVSAWAFYKGRLYNLPEVQSSYAAAIRKGASEGGGPDTGPGRCAPGRGVRAGAEAPGEG